VTMGFNVDYPSADPQTSIKCRSCEDEKSVESVELEQAQYLTTGEERCQMRCPECGVVLMTFWNGNESLPDSEPTMQDVCNRILSLKEELKNVMTEEDIEELEEEIDDINDMI